MNRVLALLLSLFLIFQSPVAGQAGSAFPENAPEQAFFLSPYDHTQAEETFQVSSADTSLQKNCPKDSVFISAIVFSGNKKTKEKVLRAELDIAEGDLLDSVSLAKKVEENRLRLFNLQLFHWVKSDISCTGSQATVTFSFQERWYFFPVPIFSLADRNINAWLKKKDFNRIDYGLHVVQQNVRGRNETLRSNLQHGFNRKYELFYAIPYISRRHKLGLAIGASHYQSHYLEYTTLNDTLATFRDETGFPVRRTYFSVDLIRRENVQRQWQVGLSWHQEQISDSAFILNPAYFSGARSRTFLQLDLFRIINLRNTFAYPLTGSYFRAGVSYRQFLAGHLKPMATFNVKYSRYHQLPRQFYYSYGAEAQTRLTRKIAYADNIALGYKTYGRGYEQNYVVGGQHYLVLKQGFSKRALSREINLEFIKNPKFNKIPVAVYFNIFADGGYVADDTFTETNRLTNRFLGSTGIGMHLVTYYDKVITLELSRNREGENGFLIHTAFPF